MRKKFIAGNWKMNTTRAQARDLARTVVQNAVANDILVALCPPFPWLDVVKAELKNSQVTLGAQNCHAEASGAYTGEVSAAMLKELGCDWVILGHSERRHGLGETDQTVNAKIHRALATELQVIFCIGELLAERQQEKTEMVLDQQLTLGLAQVTAAQMANIVIAYEPVWAIGTGQVATEEQAQAAHLFIRSKIRQLFDEKTAVAVLIQYGGSVKPDNAVGLLRQPDIDGALVGGASLQAESFLGIIRAAG